MFGTFHHPGSSHHRRTTDRAWNARVEGQQRAEALLSAARERGSVVDFGAKTYGPAAELADVLWVHYAHGCRRLRRQLARCFRRR